MLLARQGCASGSFQSRASPHGSSSPHAQILRSAECVLETYDFMPDYLDDRSGRDQCDDKHQGGELVTTGRVQGRCACGGANGDRCPKRK
jgi:hypothetical protein